MNVFDNLINGAAEHVVAESSLLHSTVCGKIYSVKMIADTDNGAIIGLGAYDTTNYADGQVFAGKAYANGDIPVLVLTPPLAYNNYSKATTAEKYFYNKTGEIARCYGLEVNDIYTVSANAITKITGATDITVGNLVSVAAGGLYQEVAKTSVPTAGFYAEIIEKVVYKNSVSYRLLVKRV